MDGCTGTLSANLYGQIQYLWTPDDNGNGYYQWYWWDSVDPLVFKFSVGSSDLGDPILRFLYKDSHGQDKLFALGAAVGQPGETDFEARVDPSTGYIALKATMSGASLALPTTKNASVGLQAEGDSGYNFRITPTCCPKLNDSWPFFAEDPLASHIMDLRIERLPDFHASQTQTLCDNMAKAEAVAQLKIDRLAEYSQSIMLEEASMPTGGPAEWRHRDLPICMDLCDSPNVCLDTGDCACGQFSCKSRQRSPWALATESPNLFSQASRSNQSAWAEADYLSKEVNRSSWLRVLHPHAARYFSQQPRFPKINVTSLPENVQTQRTNEPDRYDNLLPGTPGCFTADSAMERGLKLLSSEYDPESFVFLPYYEGSHWVSWPAYILQEKL